MEVFKYLPFDLVKQCLEFDNRFAVRAGKIMQRISRDDPRFVMLEKKPMIECRKEAYNYNVHTSYYDGSSLPNNRYRFSFTYVFHFSKNIISYYVRKIDSNNDREVSMRRYNIE